MKAKYTFKFIIISSFLFFTSVIGYSQTQFLWQTVNESNIPVTGTRYISANKYSTFHLDLNQMKTLLQSAPVNELSDLKTSNFLLDLPMPDGSFETFKVSETPMMEPALAAMFPEIKTYSGAGLNNDGLYLKFDVTPQGFHGMILTAGQGTVYIDPYYFGALNAENYIIYKKGDFKSLANKVFQCDLISEPVEEPEYDPRMLGTCQMKTYRLAVSATGEYTTFHGGTIALAQAAQVTTINRINGVYEKDCAVHMNIVANNNLIVYTNAGTDPFTNGTPGTMINQNQTNTDAVITSANYDIGHVFGTNSGGLAGLGVVCTNGQKARGVTGSSAPVGDPFDIDYVAHEIGHQFGGSHTFHSGAGSCAGNMNNATAMEPGSGSTIQAYAGICAPQDLQPNSDDYFHGISLQEIANEIASGGHACEVVTALSNNAPVISTTTATYQIPASTPFSLTVIATDADPTNVLTYCWEQMNGGALVTMPPVGTNTSGPNFRSWDPVTSPTRYFPRLSDLAAGIAFPWEVLPTVTRTLNFRVVVRDNAPGGGCNDHEDFIVTTNSTSGPFTVTYPTATGITWPATTSQTVTWAVNNTNIAPVSCANVDILLSTDGGLTYPTILLANTPNDGTQAITVPNSPSTTCRVMVRAVGNIFFDISNNNFTITNTPGCTLSVATTPVNASCGLNNGSATTNVSNSTGSVTYAWSNGATTANVTGLAAGTYTVTVSDGSPCTATATAVISNAADATNPVATCQNVTVYLDNTGNRTITGSTINNGSTDNCSIASLSANPSTFNCNDISFPNAQRLFISEYTEGTGNNKCIEIANFTGAAVDLAAGGYQLKIFNNGSATAVSTTNLTGVIPNNNVFVICNNTAGGTFLAQADQTSANLNYTGDDAILLSRTGNDTVDIFGKIGCDPGTQWVNGALMTADRTLRRNVDVNIGVLSNPTGACNTTSFTTLTTQWAVFATDNNANLGAHTFSSLNPVVLTVTDAAGNTNSCTSQITVLDTVRPTITSPANVSVPPNSGCNATGVALGSPTTGDNCSVATITNNSPGTFPSGITVVTWTVTDGSGNTRTSTQTVTVTDNIAPVPNVGILPNATGQCSVTLTAPLATDNCLGAVTGTTLNPTTYNTQGTFVVTWNYTDGAGNTSTQTQTVIVDDVTNPVTPTLSNVTGQCSATPTAPTTTDNCAGTITGTTPTTFPITTQGTTVVTWTFNDGNGNSITANQNVIIDDVTNPVTPSLGNLTGQCSITPTAPTTTDNCAGTITGTTPTTFPITTQGTTVVTWTFNDGNGNSTTANQNVIIDDVTNPVTPSLGNLTGQCSVTPTAPTTSDNCVGTVTGTTSTTFPITTQGTTVVTWTFNDGNGNSTTANQNVIIDDVTNPVTPTLANVTSECSVTPTAPTTTDNCVGTVTGTTSTTFPITTQGTTVVTWTFNDGNGNSTTANQNVIIDDVTNPVTPTLANVTSECSVTPTAPTTTDNCVGTVTGTTATTFPITTQGTTVVTWTFNDGNGNSVTANQNIIIDDVTAPVPNVSSLPAATVDCITPVTAPTATDNCTGTITATTTDPVVYSTSGTYTITWTYNDGNGNTSTQTQTVIADDQVGPVVNSCPSNMNVIANTSGCNAIVTWTVPTATDACSSVSSSSSNNSGDTFPLGTTTVTYTFTDGSGNISTCSFDVTVTNDLSISGTTTDEIIGNDGTVNITISGGSSPYNFSWSNSQVSEDISGLPEGAYTVTVTDGNGCISTATFIVNSQMSIGENEGEMISIYPNPTSSFVQVTSTNDQYKTYKLHTALGQVIVTGGFNKTLSIDMTVLSSGVYHLTIGNKTYKIIRR